MIYQQGNWASIDAEDYGVWDGKLNQPNQVTRQTDIRNQGSYFPGPSNDRVFTNQWGQRCRIICEPRPRPRPHPVNLQLVARSILGRSINASIKNYPDVIIRAVIDNGRELPSTMDYRENRINVELRNGVIVRIVSFN